MDVLDLFGAELPVENTHLEFRLRVQHEVEDAILELYLKAHPSAKLKLPPQAEIVDGRVDQAAVTARWHEIRTLGRIVSDGRVTELLNEGASRIHRNESR
jgi:hypothetical protein